MKIAQNQFKAALHKSAQQIGCWVGFADAYATEVMGTAGFDWLLIDGEHAPNDLRSILTQLQVLESSTASPVVRLPIGEIWLIKQVLDAGAQSLLIPMVESAEQARELVRATRYPPQGNRGVGAALARASRFSGIADYLTTADEQICLTLQIESRAGMEALDEILQVEGVDGLFIGPADLAADMGYLGDSKAPEVHQAIRQMAAKITAAGKAAGSLALDDKTAQEYREMGFTFLAVGIDVTLLAGAARSLAQSWVK